MQHFLPGLIAIFVLLGSDINAQLPTGKVSESPPGHRPSHISSYDTVHVYPAESFSSFSWHDLFNGISYFPARGLRLATNPPIEMFNFNTVEGVNINLGLKFIWGDEQKKHFRFDNYLRYGFSNERFNAQSAFTWGFNKKRRQVLQVAGGRYVNQFNHDNPIHSSINTYYSLALRKNYMKLYGSHFGSVKYEHELFEGITLKSKIMYEDREPLENTTNFSFEMRNPEGGLEYTSNDPRDFAAVANEFSRHQALLLDLTLKVVFRQQYISNLDLKIPMGSEYPDITLHYKRGIKAFGSDVDYNFASINLGQNLDFGFFGRSSWDVNAGTFFRTRAMEFVDYQHFNGNQTIFISPSETFADDRKPLNKFQLLDYYRYSTRGSYWVVHSEHHFNGYIADRIPFLRQIGAQAIIALNFLQTNDDVVHFEFSSGLENIFRMFRIDFVTGYNNSEKLLKAIRLRMELANLTGTR